MKRLIVTLRMPKLLGRPVVLHSLVGLLGVLAGLTGLKGLTLGVPVDRQEKRVALK